MFAISTGSILVVSLETRILGIFDWLLFIFKIDFIPFQVFLMLPQLVLTLKRLGGQFDHHPCSFSKTVSSKERMRPWIFATVNIIISHIFPENLIETSRVLQKLWRVSLSILAIFINFHRFSGFFDISLLQRNYWCHLITDDVSTFTLSIYSK